MKKVLILSPHTDDAEIAMGATLKQMSDSKIEVKHICFSDCRESIPSHLPDDITRDEFAAASEMLKFDSVCYNFKVRCFNFGRQSVLDLLIEAVRDFPPDTVFMPSHNDIHQDHQTIHQEALRAFKHSTLYGYELPWNNLEGSPNLFNQISEDDLKFKLSLVANYKSQAHRHYTAPEFIRAIAVMRGGQVGVPLAEAFYQYRTIWKTS